MFERNDVVIFLRVVQGCNINCSHCFTLGNQDQVLTTPMEYVVKFLEAIKNNVDPQRGVIYLHGGETFLAPMSYLKEVTAFARKNYGAAFSIIPQTNLIYTIDEEYLDFIRNHCDGHVGVSWDAKIRFGSIKSEHAVRQEQLFFKNFKLLIAAGIKVHVNITVQKHLFEYSPQQIADMFEGANSIDFEHLSVFNEKTKAIRPNLKRWAQWLDGLTNIYENQNVSWCLPQIDMFVKSLENGITYQCKCNCCDRRTFTLNPNGSTGFCPDNSYIDPSSHVDVAHADWALFERKAHEAFIARLATLNTENCFACEHYNECGGNCEDTLFDDSGECPLSKMTIARIKEHKDKFIKLLYERSEQNLLEFTKGKS